MDENTTFTGSLRKRATGASVFLIAGITLVVTTVASSGTAYGQDADHFELNRLLGYTSGLVVYLDYDASSCGNDSSQAYTTTLDKAGKVCGKSFDWVLAVMARDFGSTPKEILRSQLDKAAEQQKNLGGCDSEPYQAYIKIMKMEFHENLSKIKLLCR
jgi:hypothetical protein